MLRPAPNGVVHLVGGAAGPLGGDDLALDVFVAAGARLRLRGVAAMLAQPGAGDEPARYLIHVVVEEDAELDVDLNPTVVVAGARLEVDVIVDVAGGGRLRWQEEIVLGRSGEPPGTIRSRTRLTHAGAPVLDHALTVGNPGGTWDGPGGLAGHRWIGTTLHVGDIPTPRLPTATPSARTADLVLPDGSLLRAATAPDRHTGLPLLTP